ncbi:MAG: methionine adenosyltransferase [Polyangiaceae bacterium]|nr:methionine adenosyltransferase [Polyangiaceae bacterium]
MELVVRRMDGAAPNRGPVEIVERKGQGHPDSLCDAIAERISAKLCRAYLQETGTVLHHNVDKILLCGGASQPAFGGGRVNHPIEIHLTGRVTEQVKDHHFPVDELAVTACREVLAEHVRYLDLRHHVRIYPHFRGGSADLTELYVRNTTNSIPLSNDTSIGSGFAPRTDLERAVFAAEKALASAETRTHFPAIGDDVKVMGVRIHGKIALTVACAMVDRHVPDLPSYLGAKEAASQIALRAARSETPLELTVHVNTADNPDKGSVYLTVTGTSAEAGDDGQVGRGNRTSGLITPYRPMTLEAAAGKNPVTHVGKLYSLLAEKLCIQLCTEHPEVAAAECVLVSRIGHPVTDPQVVDVAVELRNGSSGVPTATAVLPIVERVLAGLPQLRDDLIAGRIFLF